MNHALLLADMQRPELGRIAAIRGASPDELRQMLEVGLTQDAEIRVVQNDRRHVLVFARDHEVALDRQAAGCIWVEVEIV